MPNPIKLKKGERRDEYELSINLGYWVLTRTITDSDLIQLRKDIDDIQGVAEIMEKYNCS